MCERTDILILKCERIVNETQGSAEKYFKELERISENGIKTPCDKLLAQAAVALLVQQMIYNHALNKIVGLTSNEIDEIEETISETI